MESLEKFLHHRKGDAFGLTIFSRNFIHWVPLTLDTEAIMLSRPFIAPNVLPDELWGGTFIGNALYGASAHLAERPVGDRMIILLTDGESPDIKSPKDVAIIADLKDKGVLVFAVFLTNDAVDPGLINICRSTGGEAFNAVTPEALNAVFKRIDEMKKVVVLEKKITIRSSYRRSACSPPPSSRCSASASRLGRPYFIIARPRQAKARPRAMSR
jgi:Ca-activated chloride channel family protein